MLSWDSKTLTINLNGKQNKVTIDRVKPAYFFREDQTAPLPAPLTTDDLQATTTDPPQTDAPIQRPVRKVRTLSSLTFVTPRGVGVATTISTSNGTPLPPQSANAPACLIRLPGALLLSPLPLFIVCRKERGAARDFLNHLPAWTRLGLSRTFRVGIKGAR